MVETLVATDTELVDAVYAVQTGDSQAFETIYEQTIIEMKSWVAYHCHNWDMVEECLQQTYIAAYHSLPGFDPERPLLPWLKGIARHQIGKYLRSQQRQQNREHQAFLHTQQQRLDNQTFLDDVAMSAKT